MRVVPLRLNGQGRSAPGAGGLEQEQNEAGWLRDKRIGNACRGTGCAGARRPITTLREESGESCSLAAASRAMGSTCTSALAGQPQEPGVVASLAADRWCAPPLN